MVCLTQYFDQNINLKFRNSQSSNNKRNVALTEWPIHILGVDYI